MQTDTLTLYKLIILFILNKVDFPLTNNQMTGFILEKEYTNFLNIQQAMSELLDSELISSEIIRNISYFRTTNAGKETLTFFDHDIPDAIKEDVINYLKEKKYELREEVSSLADYYEAKKGEYIAHCFVRENESNIVEVSLNVPTLEEAEAICSHWREKSQEVYEFLVRTLM